MAPEKRLQTTGVEDRLFEEYYNYSFYQAVHLLETFSPEKKKLGTTLQPGKEAVRFSVKPGLAFPASDISRLAPAKDDTQPAQMEVAFMGLIGPAGVLPHCYNELALERVSKKDQTLVDFLNIFHHRLISLFYLAWKKNKFSINFQPGARDRLSKNLLSLCGLGTKALRGRIGLPEESLSYFSGLLSRQVPTAAAIQSTVEHFSGTKAEIEQFVQRLIPLDDDDQTRIGKANCALGIDTICGTRVWECQTKFRVSLLSMKLADFKRFLPDGDLHRPIFSLVKYMVGMEYEFDMIFYLKKEEVPDCSLGQLGSQASRLGWTTWIKSSDFQYKEDPHIAFHENQECSHFL